MLIISAKPDALLEEPQPHPDDQVFAKLGGILDQHGVTWIMLHRAGEPPWMLVNAEHSFRGTYLYVAHHPVLHLSAIFGFGRIYLGLAVDLQKVTDRLVYMLKATR